MTHLPQLPASVLRLIAAALAPAGEGARVSTLIFHRVLPAPDQMQLGEVTSQDFEHVLLWCSQLFNIISLADAVGGLKSGRLPARPLVITFDDGYADNHDLAAPILHKLGLPATFFIASGYLDGGRMFNDVVAHAIGRCSAPELDLTELDLGRHSLANVVDRRDALSRLLPLVKVMHLSHRNEVVERICRLANVELPQSLMMTSDQVASLKRQGFEIGAHTDMHPILARMEAAAARAEIQRGRSRLQEITGASVRFFAYPNGRPGEDFTPQTVQIVREVGFDAAYTTTPGVATIQTDPFQLPRFTPWDREPLKFGLRMIRNLLNARSLTAESARTIGGQSAVTV